MTRILEEVSDYLDSFESAKRKNIITAALLEVGGKRYPKFGNVVIFAGGSGSGKGFQLAKLIGIEGRVVDIGHLEHLMLVNELWCERAKEELGKDISNLNLKNPEDVQKLKEVSKELKLNNRMIKELNYIKESQTRKPNLIFDVTLNHYMKFKEICKKVKQFGYDKQNIHLIWVLNDLDVALKQNKERLRVVDEDIVKTIHYDVSTSLRTILKTKANEIQNQLDGDVWISFNQFDVDIIIENSEVGNGFVIKEANALKVKSSGEPIHFPEGSESEIFKKIAEYTHNPDWLI